MLVFQSRSCMSEGSGPRRPATAGEVPPAEGDIGKADTDKTSRSRSGGLGDTALSRMLSTVGKNVSVTVGKEMVGREMGELLEKAQVIWGRKGLVAQKRHWASLTPGLRFVALIATD